MSGVTALCDLERNEKSLKTQIVISAFSVTLTAYQLTTFLNPKKLKINREVFRQQVNIFELTFSVFPQSSLKINLSSARRTTSTLKAITQHLLMIITSCFNLLKANKNQIRGKLHHYGWEKTTMTSLSCLYRFFKYTIIAVQNLIQVAVRPVYNNFDLL